MALPEHMKTGLRGEQLAARFLRNKNYEIIAANYATALGESDIIAVSPDGTVCFVEVKTRSEGHLLPPSEAVDYAKQSRLQTNAAAFLKQAKLTEKAIRFDIVEVILYDLNSAEINHIENAF